MQNSQTTMVEVKPDSNASSLTNAPPDAFSNAQPKANANLNTNANTDPSAHPNPYAEACQFHPCLKPNGKNYWILGPSISKEDILRKAGSNLMNAIDLNDNDYIDFLSTYLLKEGYAVTKAILADRTLKKLEEMVNSRSKIKIQISLKPNNHNGLNGIPTFNTNIGTNSPIEVTTVTHSKNKTKKHEKGLLMQKQSAATQLRVLAINDDMTVNDRLIRALKLIGSTNEMIRLLTTDGLPIHELNRHIIIYIHRQNLQKGATFKIDDKLRAIFRVGYTDGYATYFQLRGLICDNFKNVKDCPNYQSSDIESIDDGFDSEFGVDNGVDTGPNRVPITLKKKPLIRVKPKLI